MKHSCFAPASAPVSFSRPSRSTEMQQVQPTWWSSWEKSRSYFCKGVSFPTVLRNLYHGIPCTAQLKWSQRKKRNRGTHPTAAAAADSCPHAFSIYNFVFSATTKENVACVLSLRWEAILVKKGAQRPLLVFVKWQSLSNKLRYHLPPRRENGWLDPQY